MSTPLAFYNTLKIFNESFDSQKLTPECSLGILQDGDRDILEDLFLIFHQLNAFIYFCGGQGRGYFECCHSEKGFITTFDYTRSQNIKLYTYFAHFKPDQALERLFELTKNFDMSLKLTDHVVKQLPLVTLDPCEKPFFMDKRLHLQLDLLKMRMYITRLMVNHDVNIRSLAIQLQQSLDILEPPTQIERSVIFPNKADSEKELILVNQLLKLLDADINDFAYIFDVLQIIDHLNLSEKSRLILTTNDSNCAQLITWISAISETSHSFAPILVKKLMSVLCGLSPNEDVLFENLASVFKRFPIQAYSTLITCKQSGMFKTNLMRSLIVLHMAALIKSHEPGKIFIIYGSIKNMFEIFEGEDSYCFSVLKDPESFIVDLTRLFIDGGYISEALFLFLNSAKKAFQLVHLKNDRCFEIALHFLSCSMDLSHDLINQWDLFDMLIRKQLNKDQKKQLCEHFKKIKFLEGIYWLNPNDQVNEYIENVSIVGNFLEHGREFHLCYDILQRAILQKDLTTSISVLYRLLQLIDVDDYNFIGNQKLIRNQLVGLKTLMKTHQWKRNEFKVVQSFLKILREKKSFLLPEIIQLGGFFLDQMIQQQQYDKVILHSAVDLVLQDDSSSFSHQDLMNCVSVLETVKHGKMSALDFNRYWSVFDRLIAFKLPLRAIQVILSLECPEKYERVQVAFEVFFTQIPNAEQMISFRRLFREFQLSRFSKDFIKTIVERAFLLSLQLELTSEIGAWKLILEDEHIANQEGWSEEFNQTMFTLSLRKVECLVPVAEFLNGHSSNLKRIAGYNEMAEGLCVKLIPLTIHNEYNYLIFSLLKGYGIKNKSLWLAVIEIAYNLDKRSDFVQNVTQSFYNKFNNSTDLQASEMEVWVLIFPTIMHHFSLRDKLDYLEKRTKNWCFDEGFRIKCTELLDKCLFELKQMSKKKQSKYLHPMNDLCTFFRKKNVGFEPSIVAKQESFDQLVERCYECLRKNHKNAAKGPLGKLICSEHSKNNQQLYDQKALPLILEFIKANIPFDFLSTIEHLVSLERRSCNVVALNIFNYTLNNKKDLWTKDNQIKLVESFESIIQLCNEEKYLLMIIEYLNKVSKHHNLDALKFLLKKAYSKQLNCLCHSLNSLLKEENVDLQSILDTLNEVLYVVFYVESCILDKEVLNKICISIKLLQLPLDSKIKVILLFGCLLQQQIKTHEIDLSDILCANIKNLLNPLKKEADCKGIDYSKLQDELFKMFLNMIKLKLFKEEIGNWLVHLYVGLIPSVLLKRKHIEVLIKEATKDGYFQTADDKNRKLCLQLMIINNQSCSLALNTLSNEELVSLSEYLLSIKKKLNVNSIGEVNFVYLAYNITQFGMHADSQIDFIDKCGIHVQLFKIKGDLNYLCKETSPFLFLSRISLIFELCNRLWKKNEHIGCLIYDALRLFAEKIPKHRCLYYKRLKEVFEFSNKMVIQLKNLLMTEKNTARRAVLTRKLNGAQSLYSHASNLINDYQKELDVHLPTLDMKLDVVSLFEEKSENEMIGISSD